MCRWRKRATCISYREAGIKPLVVYHSIGGSTARVEIGPSTLRLSITTAVDLSGSRVPRYVRYRTDKFHTDISHTVAPLTNPFFPRKSVRFCRIWSKQTVEHIQAYRPIIRILFTRWPTPIDTLRYLRHQKQYVCPRSAVRRLRHDMCNLLSVGCWHRGVTSAWASHWKCLYARNEIARCWEIQEGFVFSVLNCLLIVIGINDRPKYKYINKLTQRLL